MATELGRDTSGLKPGSNHKSSFSHTSYSQLYQVKETAVKLFQWSSRTPVTKESHLFCGNLQEVQKELFDEVQVSWVSC